MPSSPVVILRSSYIAWSVAHIILLTQLVSFLGISRFTFSLLLYRYIYLRPHFIVSLPLYFVLYSFVSCLFVFVFCSLLHLCLGFFQSGCIVRFHIILLLSTTAFHMFRCTLIFDSCLPHHLPHVSFCIVSSSCTATLFLQSLYFIFALWLPSMA